MHRTGNWRRRTAAAIVAVAALAGPASGAHAYTAAGDRVFPATLLLPQSAPSDEVYLNAFSLPGPGGAADNFNLTYSKTLTDRLGITLEESYSDIAHSFGWQNLDSEIKYLAVNDRDREFLLTLGLDREFGGTGARRVGAEASGATTPRIYFGKGLGALANPYLRPLAVTGYAAMQIADAAPRPDQATGGLVVEYSIPYLQSKVEAFDLPDFLRAVTPMVEFAFTIPAGTSYGARTTALVAPGIDYAGEGWEIGAEALLPQSHATGRGIGFTAQVHIALDFFMPETIGRPIVSRP